MSESGSEFGGGSVLQRAWANDTVKILVVIALLYAAYLLMGNVLGYSLRGQLNSLARLTFLVAIYALLALALNLQWGYTGLFNIGVVGFMAVGLYTMAAVSKPTATGGAALVAGLGMPVVVGVLAGMGAAALLGLVVALPALRLRADYLAITTIAMAEIVRFFFMSSMFQTWTFRPITVSAGSFEVVLFSRLFGDGLTLGTGGGRGLILNYADPMNPVFESRPYEWLIAQLDPMVEGNIEPVVDGFTYAVVLLVVFVTAYYLLLRRIGRSPFGRVLKAIREDEQVANALGKNTAQFKIKSFMLGCALMGLAGILWQMRQGAITPNSFRPKVTFYVWVALIIGGAGSNTGSVLGGAVFAAVLFQGPRYVKNVLVDVYSDALPPSPGKITDAMGPLLDPVLVFGNDLYNVVPVALLFGVAVGILYLTSRLAHTRADPLGERLATVARERGVAGRLDAVADAANAARSPTVWARRLIWVGGVLAFVGLWALLVAAGGDPLPFVAYALGNINPLQLVFMGLVLVWLIRVRPDGLLGHRKEVASSVPLLDAEGRAVRPKATAADGGEEE